jgi:putative ABC transport system substrate-binding protein
MRRIILVFLVVVTILNLAHVAEAQSPSKVPRIVFLGSQSQPSGRVEAFRHGLRQLGYVDGQNLKFEYLGHDDRSQLPRLATALIQEKSTSS